MESWIFSPPPISDLTPIIITIFTVYEWLSKDHNSLLLWFKLVSESCFYSQRGMGSIVSLHRMLWVRKKNTTLSCTCSKITQFLPCFQETSWLSELSITAQVYQRWQVFVKVNKQKSCPMPGSTLWARVSTLMLQRGNLTCVHCGGEHTQTSERKLNLQVHITAVSTCILQRGNLVCCTLWMWGHPYLFGSVFLCIHRNRRLTRDRHTFSRSNIDFF